ncbi:hypothetical protein CBER1_09072 [Cercospora berteroae]|uniref:MYND-type domain-containing protein n=1 Tax=Cercospora berteroae TaxID=357750 RepID=A0A2S6BWM4_9PEZI|nr:hypothetical protein CBER1_09072 [Cercospora berteroae]
MGGWSLQLFSCDMDLAFIEHLNERCGLVDLEETYGKTIPPDHETAVRQRKKEHVMLAQTPEGKRFDEGEFDKDQVNFSVLGPLCTHLEFVRRHVDTTGGFTAEMADLRKKCLQSRRGVSMGLSDPYGPAYRLCLLGACGMTLGVKISDDERNAMRKHYQDCGLMRDAVTQLGAALDSDIGYVNGVPWDFGSLRHNDMTVPAKEDLILPGLMNNIWAPDHGRRDDEMEVMCRGIVDEIEHKGHRPTVDEMTTIMACALFKPLSTPRTSISSTKADADIDFWRPIAQKYVAELAEQDAKALERGKKICGSCGVNTKADGSPLLVCGKCRQRWYCSAGCQKEEWKVHKKICGPLKKVDPMRSMVFLMR